MVGRPPPWPRFASALCPKACCWRISHRRVEWTCPDRPVGRAATGGNPGVVTPGVHVARAGGSAALRLAVPRVDHLRPFAEQEGEVLAAFAAVESL